MRRNKYGARRTFASQMWFDSQMEATRYGELLWLQEVGDISDLRCQPSFTISVGDPPMKICVYRVDFEYFERSSGLWIVEDVKGVETEVFKIKAKLFRALIKDRELRIIKKEKNNAR